MTDHGWYGCQIVFFHDESCIDWNEAENGRETRVHLNEPMKFDVAVNSNLGFTVHVNSETKIYFCVKMCLVE